MATAGHANLHHGGGGCSPFPKTHEEVYNCELKTSNTAGFGTCPTFDFAPDVDKYLYEQPEIPKTQPWPSTVECAKGAGYVALSRELHFAAPEYSKFRLATESRQKDLWRWFLENRERIVPDFCLNLIFVPMCIEFERLYLRICNGVPGLTVDIIDFYTEEVIVAGVDLGQTGRCIKFPQHSAGLQWSPDCNRMISMKILTVPPINEDECKPGKGVLDGLNMEISAKVFCPWAGE